MRKIIVASLIILAVVGGILNLTTDQQVREGVPLTQTYLNCTSCLQTVLWVFFSLISGFTLLFDTEPIALWLEKIRPKRNNKLALRLMGLFLLVTIPLSSYTLGQSCKLICLTL